MTRLATILLVLLLHGGALAPWAVLSQAKAAEEPEAEEPLPDPAFIKLDPLVLPLIQNGQITHHVEFQIVLDINSKDLKFVEAILPRVIDRFIAELHGLLSLQFVREAPNPRELLRDRLRLLSWRLLGREVVNDILLSNFKKFRPRGG